MGWNWAFSLGQAAMTEQVVQGSGLGPEAVLTDHGEVPSLEGGRVALLPYCDNSHAAGTDA